MGAKSGDFAPIVRHNMPLKAAFPSAFQMTPASTMRTTRSV